MKLRQPALIVPPQNRHYLLKWVLRASEILAWVSLGGLLSLLAVFAYSMQSRTDLSIWHTVELDQEFTANSQAETFSDYLAIEERVFSQLEGLVHDQAPAGKRQLINRYNRDSLSAPEKWPRNWNRSYELPTASPRAGVLLLHGMSDSPYSLRGLGQRLHQDNAWVLGLRFPGHGTAPAGLTSLRWQDMARAVELAMAALRQKVGDKPIYIVGYSAGGALAIHYALQTLGDKQRPRADKIVLISPAIGVTSLAVLAVWQARLGYVLGLDKLEWTDIKLEYDPFKYNSFAVNAGDQVYRLTAEISNLLEVAVEQGNLDKLPPLLAFQSAVDATVSTPALIEGLFSKLSPAGHELVLFDINRRTEIELVLKQDPAQVLGPLLAGNDLPFTLSILSNRNDQSSETVLFTRTAGSTEVQETDTGLNWPDDVYSLSHVALPFSENDRLYGSARMSGHVGIHIGDLVTRGERGIIKVSPGDMLRLRWNPFYPLLEQKIINFLH